MANLMGFSPFATVEHPLINAGKPTNIPTMIRGRAFEPDTAAQLIAQFSKMRNSVDPIHPETGAPLPSFASTDEAQAALKNMAKQIQDKFTGTFQPLQQIFQPAAQQIQQAFDSTGLGSIGLGSSSFFRPW